MKKEGIKGLKDQEIEELRENQKLEKKAVIASTKCVAIQPFLVSSEKSD